MRRIPSFTASLRAWREISGLVAVSRLRLVGIAVLSAGVGITESAFLGILASLGVAIAGRDEGALKLPFLSVDGLTIPTLIWVGAALALTTMAAQFVITLQLSRIQATVTATMRRELYRDFAHASWRVQRSEVESTFVNYMVFHVPRVANLVNAVLSQLISYVTLIVFVVGALLISPVISLVVIVLGLLLFVCFLPVRGIARRAGKDSQIATRALFSTFREAISASREIKAYGVEDPVRERVNSEIENLELPAVRMRVAAGFVPVLYQRLVFLIMLGGLGLVYALDIRDVGAIGASMLIILRAMQQAQSVQASDPIIAESLPWVGELKDGRTLYRQNQTAFGTTPLPSVDEIEFEGVSYSYGAGDVLALDGVSFKAKRGQLLGIIGPSGSGKSTLSELIVRLDEPTAGTYRVNGRDASEFSRTDWTRQVVLVPQLGHLIAATIADNIRFLRPNVSEDEVRVAADRANLTSDVLEFDEGFETVVGERGHRGLSGGQRQRLSIARAVAVTPSLIVLDEPTSALDHKAESVIVETIETLRKHACVVVIAHRLSTLRHCDRVLVLRDGKTEAFCSPEELTEKSEFFRGAGSVFAP